MSSWRMLGCWKRLLRFRLRSLLVLVTFAAVLLGWWSDRLRMEEQLRRRDDLLTVLRATRRNPLIDWGDSTRLRGKLLWFDSHREFLAAVRDGKPWPKVDGERPTLFFSSAKIAHDVLSDLARLLSDADVNVRLKAAYSLRSIGHLSPTIAPQLMAAVRDESPDVRCEAIWALQEIDGILSGSGPLLAPYLHGDRPDECKAIVGAIRKHDPSYDLDARLLKLVTHPLPESRITAAEGLSMGPDTRPEVVTGLLAMLADPDVKCRRVAAGRLGHARPSGELLHRLSQAFKTEPESDVRLAIACAVEGIHRRLGP